MADSKARESCVKIAKENGHFIVDLPSQNGDFNIFMLVHQRVILVSQWKEFKPKTC